MKVVDKQTGEVSWRDVLLQQDEGARPETTTEGLASLRTVFPGGTVTAGNASQLSDGASACVLMEAKEAERRGPCASAAAWARLGCSRCGSRRVRRPQVLQHGHAGFQSLNPGANALTLDQLAQIGGDAEEATTGRRRPGGSASQAAGGVAAGGAALAPDEDGASVGAEAALRRAI